MKKLMFLTKVFFGMGIVLMFTTHTLAQQPTKDQIVAAKATYSGTLKQKDGGGADWACTATVKGDGVVQVQWSDSTVTYTGKMGPAAGKAGNPIAMNGTGSDKSEVRFQWNSLDGLQVEWWTNMAAKAGQTQNKPAQVSGMIRRVNETVSGNQKNPCSKDGGKPMNISWKNNTNMTLRINWINSACKEENNDRQIKPGETYNGASYEGHWFIIRDFETNKQLGYREVKPEYANMGIPK